MLAEHTHNVTFRQDAFDVMILHHQHRTDMTLGQDTDSIGQLGVCLDAYDFESLGAENCLNCHCQRLP